MGRKLRNGIIKPFGVSIHCINHSTGKFKIRYPDETSAGMQAHELGLLRSKRYDVYYCKACQHFHIGRPSRNLRLGAIRGMRDEIGPRAMTHLKLGDTIQSIRDRFEVMERRRLDGARSVSDQAKVSSSRPTQVSHRIRTCRDFPQSIGD